MCFFLHDVEKARVYAIDTLVKKGVNMLELWEKIKLNMVSLYGTERDKRNNDDMDILRSHCNIQSYEITQI